jgi:hypothetical protein
LHRPARSGEDTLGRRLHDANFSHRPLQLPLHLLHAARRVRSRLRVSAASRIAELEEMARLARVFRMATASRKSA